MNPGPTFDRVYTAMKHRILSGQFRPGERIDPAALTDELIASMTPVRDALHRLAGERLVLAMPALGFRLPHLTEVGLRDLYAWIEACLMLAIAAAGKRHAPAGPVDRAGDVAVRTASLFQSIANGADNGELFAAIRNANDRVHMARLVEQDCIADTQAELDRIETLWRSGDAAGLRRDLRRYHRRRQRMAPSIVARLSQRGSSTIV
jgi:hypothetical protein